ncbi:MAG: hypothetical protein A2Z17_06545 [Gammaproteobacteria bacterium RBG_16_66_13]|nr:MAG: hypothetical protein A2Z17_06545 [Gammaproteobacteria bacterium RBG_16_66_13]
MVTWPELLARHGPLPDGKAVPVGGGGGNVAVAVAGTGDGAEVGVAAGPGVQASAAIASMPPARRSLYLFIVLSGFRIGFPPSFLGAVRPASYHVGCLRAGSASLVDVGQAAPAALIHTWVNPSPGLAWDFVPG